MTSQTAVDQRNLESKLLFIQQEHACTLKALHEEIAKLQKKCSELTFELAMLTPEVDKDDAERIKRLETDVEASRRRTDELQQETEKKEKRIRMLEQQLKAQEKKYQDELKTKNQTINTLKHELDTKSNNIALLTTELHKMKVKQRVESEKNNSQADSVHVHAAIVPIPPREGAPRARRSAVHKRTEGPPLTTTTNGHVPVIGRRPIRGVSSKSRGSARVDSPPVDVPDPAPFLQRDRDEKNRGVKIKPVPAPLPPIAAQAIENARKGGGHMVFRPNCPGMGGIHRRAPVVPSPEVETLAVDQVPGTEGKWTSRAHESQSSEYN